MVKPRFCIWQVCRRLDEYKIRLEDRTRTQNTKRVVCVNEYENVYVYEG